MSESFKYRVSITQVATGKIVEFDDVWGYPGYKRGENWENDPVFIWWEGNYSCDCNRDLFFNRISNPAYDTDMPCGESAYKLNWIKNLETNRIIYGEV